MGMLLKTKKSGMRKQAGLTIVELMVSLALGVVLVGGITRVYLENKKNYVQDDEMARLQENGRFVMNLLKREFKMSRFLAGAVPGTATGQLNPGGNITTDCSAGWALDPTNALDFVNDVTDGTSSSSITSSVAGEDYSACITQANVVPNTDIVMIKRVAGMPTIENAVYASGGTATGEEKKKSYYIKVSPSTSPEFVYVGTAGFDSAVLDAANKFSMWLYMAKVFYVRNYSVTTSDGIPTLVMVSLQDKAMVETPLIEGVEAFHIEYGVPDATSGETPARFYANPTAGQISSATVARIYLLMRTRNEIRDYTDTKTYHMGSRPALTPANKRFMRRVFTTTIKLRN